jgi:hypothetical protein
MRLPKKIALRNWFNIYRLCYIRGAEGILIGLAEELPLNK